ncbi:MAG TPA: aminotransferase class III-fold pyridoxal phosphate-dependent enzyme, partial [Gemmatimonadetes bacterium]|nr:aminotransferase class III-fold pyridoxal phosphate-dependent enzyme [Gemmatimonadota bacterium]
MTVAEPRFGSLLPDILASPPGGVSRSLAKRLKAVESRNITYVDSGWPIFWQEARGSNVRDVDGNVYIDLSGAFGVALIGHAHAGVVRALRVQGENLLHGMGDIHPPVG